MHSQSKTKICTNQKKGKKWDNKVIRAFRSVHNPGLWLQQAKHLCSRRQYFLVFQIEKKLFKHQFLLLEQISKNTTTLLRHIWTATIKLEDLGGPIMVQGRKSLKNMNAIWVTCFRISVWQYSWTQRLHVPQKCTHVLTYFTTTIELSVREWFSIYHMKICKILNLEIFNVTFLSGLKLFRHNKNKVEYTNCSWYLSQQLTNTSDNYHICTLFEVHFTCILLYKNHFKHGLHHDHLPILAEVNNIYKTVSWDSAPLTRQAIRKNWDSL